MSLKVNFLYSHIDCFPENLGVYSEEQGERFHQDARDIKKRYQGRWDVNMLVDYSWMIRQETEDGCFSAAHFSNYGNDRSRMKPSAINTPSTQGLSQTQEIKLNSNLRYETFLGYSIASYDNERELAGLLKASLRTFPVPALPAKMRTLVSAEVLFRLGIEKIKHRS
ncbi:hypothetical protein AVEN_112409-1 [Araneus ventricosus]|uniref:Uncharacterized protein n=1 Tax=Araneus ventricosus TaxID=182803 RepID=A0A4Y2P8F0_ARAVE|nr:hypothetical protein AVEN_112409-1 [Araneus ventricosus]